MALLPVRAAAERLAVHPATVRRLIARGELSEIRIGRAVRVRVEELEAFERSGGDGPQKVSKDQLKALHAKAAAIDRAKSRDLGTAKRVVMGAASERFGRPLTSAGDLTFEEADWVLDQLQEQLDRLRRS